MTTINYRSTLRERLKNREEWLRDYLIYNKHNVIVKNNVCLQGLKIIKNNNELYLTLNSPSIPSNASTIPLLFTLTL